MRHFAFATVAVVTVMLGATITPAYPEDSQDQATLSGLSEVKVAFDVTNGDGKALLKQLDVIDETRQSLIKQGVKPYFVITFRGPATKLVQKDQSQIKAEDREYAAKIAEKISDLHSADGVTSIEQCGVAVRTLRHQAAGCRPWCEGCRERLDFAYGLSSQRLWLYLAVEVVRSLRRAGRREFGLAAHLWTAPPQPGQVHGAARPRGYSELTVDASWLASRLAEFGRPRIRLASSS